MKIFEQVSYDPNADACYLQISKVPVAESITKKDWLIIDKDNAWKVVGIEILAVKKHQNLVNKLLLSQQNAKTI